MFILPDITRAALDTLSLPANEADLRDLFFRAPQEFNQLVPQKDNGLTVLKLYLHWLDDIHARYEALGIPEDVYQDNLKDIAL